MHELPITEELLAKVLAEVKNTNSKVVKVWLRVGEHTGYVDESISFYWGIVAANTQASRAKIIIKRIPGKLRCWTCNRKIKKVENINFCPYCNSFKLVIEGGDELILEAIEIKEEK